MNRDRLKAKQLLDTINHKRQEMIKIANREGYTSGIAVKCSQDLDLLLNEYQHILLAEKEQNTGPFQDFVHSMKIWKLANSIHYS